MELAELPTVNPLDRFLKVGDAPSLRPRLKNPLRHPHRLAQLLAKRDGDAAWLFTIDILACLRCQDGSSCVPAIPGCDEDRVDVFAVEQFPKIPVELAVTIGVVLIHELLPSIAPFALHVSNRYTTHVLEREHRLEIVGTTWANSDDPQLNPIAGGRAAWPSQHMARDDSGRRRSKQAIGQKSSTRRVVGGMHVGVPVAEVLKLRFFGPILAFDEMVLVLDAS